MRSLMLRFLRAESGTTVIEYALITCLMFLVIVGSVQALGAKIVNTLSE